MKRQTRNILCLMVLTSCVVFAQGLTIGSGAIFSLGSATFSLPGNWNNNGTFNPNSGTVIFNGTGTQTIADASGEIFNNLVVNKSAGDVQLANNITVNGNLTLTSGDIDMNGKTISLGSSALVSETPGNTVKGNGSISGTTTLNAPSSVNPFGLGAIITSSANLGITTITRGHSQQLGGSETSILRFFEISPATNTGLNATLIFMYDESELNGKTENNLALYKSPDAGTTWNLAGGTVDGNSNTVTISGVNGFSRWTLGDSSLSFPVELTSFSATVQRHTAIIQWCTATEVNNHGFEIERASVIPSKGTISESTFREGWNAIGFVEGNGTTNSPKSYSFVDATARGRVVYRLKQIDNDGKFTYSQEVELEVGSAPKVFHLAQNYPNPFNPNTTIEFTLPESGEVKVAVYDILGKEVAMLFNDAAESGKYYQVQFNASHLASGIYIAKLEWNGKQLLKKMMLLK